MFTDLLHNLRIYGRLLALHLRAALEYEADFWIGIVGMGLTHVSGFVFVWTFFQNVPTVAGWGLWDTVFLYALSVIPRGLVEIVSDGAWNVRGSVNRGELDRLLVRPLSPLLQILSSLSSIHGLGNVLVGGAILVQAAVALNLSWHIGNLLLLGITLLSAVVMITAISLITNSVVFWEPAATSSFPFLAYQFLEFTKFPLSVYDRFVQLFLTWILPFAFVSYFPGLVLLGKPGVSLWLAYAAPLASLVVGGLAVLIWRWGLSRYQGTGH
jgi:ABC-2 type transport system permease protein